MFSSFTFGWPEAPSPLAAYEHAEPAHAPISIHAKAVKIADGWIELDTPVELGVGGNAKVQLSSKITGGAPTVEELTLERDSPNDEHAKKRVPWDYLIIVGTAAARKLR
jgi:hypothetical protein